jgi:protoporphyrin/coproporphyrin ferrochelatase
MRTGIVLAQLGGPRNLAEVAPFIQAIFDDPRLVPLPGGLRTRHLVSNVVAAIRAPKVRSHYSLIGGGSPILETTQLQAEALETELTKRGFHVAVAVAHRYAKPDTNAALDKILAFEPDQIVLLPLYPQYSGTTTGSSEVELRAQLADRQNRLPLHVVRSWTHHDGYFDLQAELVQQMLDRIPSSDLQNGLILFSAHGLPQRLIDRGDPYREEVEATVTGVLGRLRTHVDHRLTFQSRAGPIKWLEPAVKEAVREAGAEGRKWIGIVPISFVSEHLETLFELDIELRELASDVGIEAFYRSSCFELKAGLAPMLADLLEAEL